MRIRGLDRNLRRNGGAQMSLTQRAINILKSAGPGAWYDPSDLTTLFQDSAGSVPVTAVEQPVGLMLDKSQGLVLGAELVTNGNFASDTGWSVPAGWAVGSGVVTATATNASLKQLGNPFVSGSTYRVQFDYTHVSGTLYARAGTGAAATANTSGTKTLYLVASGTTGLEFYGGTVSGSIDNISVRKLPGNHLIQPTATSRPTLKQDGNGMYHIHFDGIDDSLYSAASVDFTSTDKITVFAGVHKASDAAAGVLVELSGDPTDASNGSFSFTAPASAASDIRWISRGTVLWAATGSGVPAPATRVAAGIGDISGDVSTLRLNGVQADTSSGDQGTGNYGNYPLYVGRRNNASLPFNGRIYQLAIKGKAMTAAEISTLESYINSKTKAF